METIKWLSGILVFVRISETGSFSAAAQSLGISKSHVSKTVQLLEKELGVSLLSRSTKTVQLTHTGEQFLERCQFSLESLEDARKDLLNNSSTPRGKLRVTLAGSFGEDFVAPVAIALAKKYPDLKVELNFDNKIVDILKDKFDVAIRFGHLQDSSLLAQKIATRREFICASPQYLKKNPIIKKPEDLNLHNCLGQSGQWTFNKNGKPRTVNVKGNLNSNNPRVLLKACLSHLGIVMLPGSYVHSEIKAGKLIPILENYSNLATDIWAITPSKKKLNMNADVFVRELKVALEKDYADVLF